MPVDVGVSQLRLRVHHAHHKHTPIFLQGIKTLMMITIISSSSYVTLIPIGWWCCCCCRCSRLSTSFFLSLEGSVPFHRQHRHLHYRHHHWRCDRCPTLFFILLFLPVLTIFVSFYSVCGCHCCLVIHLLYNICIISHYSSLSSSSSSQSYVSILSTLRCCCLFSYFVVAAYCCCWWRWWWYLLLMLFCCHHHHHHHHHHHFIRSFIRSFRFMIRSVRFVRGIL